MEKRPCVAIFVDFEYLVYTSLNHWHFAVDPQRIIDLAHAHGRIGHAVAFGDMQSEPLAGQATRLRTVGIDAVSAPTTIVNGKPKSYTDFTMLDSIYQTLLDRPDINVFLLVTGDGHFSGVAARLRTRHEKVVGVVGIEHNISSELKASASFVAVLEPPRFEPGGELVQRMLRFVAQAQRDRPAITFGTTAKVMASNLQVPEELVRFNLSCLVREGAIRQENVDFGGRQSRIMKLQPDHPWVREALVE